MNDNSQEKEFRIKVGAKARTIHVDYLARVEGEGAFMVRTKDDKVEKVELKIFEPPRFFEGFMRGRALTEAPDITARICGICPVAYQMSSVNAMENGLHIEIPEYIHKLRRLLYCGEWIESHTLHIYMLHAPDFLGFQDVIQMAKEYPELVKKGLQLKKAGNEIMQVLGGREIHPINVRIGGFYQLPTKKELHGLLKPLEEAVEIAKETIRWVNTFSFPRLERSYECVAMTHPNEYPIARGTLTTTSGLSLNVEQYETHFEEYHVKRSTALRSTMDHTYSYLVGPIARYNLNREKLSPLVKEMANSIGFETHCRNPFRSIIVRALEVLYACEEALHIVQSYNEEKQPPFVSFQPKEAIGYGMSEAPRGLLYHRYALNKAGLIETAKIVAPTSQNQKTIEEDLFDFVSQNIRMPDEELTWKCEQTIRNYDPCISCSTHFLRLDRLHG